jgi:hypothetical protein
MAHVKPVKRTTLARWIAAGVLLGLLAATLAMDSITGTLGYAVVAAMAAVIMGALHPEANGKLARWAVSVGLRSGAGATLKNYPEYFQAKKSPLVIAATLMITRIVVSFFAWTR